MAKVALNEDPVYVAVSKNVCESKLTLLWALRNLQVKKLFLLHVHQQIPMNPLSSGLEQSEIDAIQDLELKCSYESLHKYRNICKDEGIIEKDVDISCKLANNVGDGIVELINENDIKKLVMGAAADSHYTKGMVRATSTKAKYIIRNAPHYCKIWFACNGNLVQTREAWFDCVGTSNSSSESLSSLHGFEEPQRAEHDTESLEDFQSARRLEAMYYEEQRRILEIEELKRENERRDKAISTSFFGVPQILYNEEVTRRREAAKELKRAKAEIKKLKKIQTELQVTSRREAEEVLNRAEAETKKLKRIQKELEEQLYIDFPRLFETIQKERDEAVKTSEELSRRLKLEKGESSTSSHNSSLSPLQWSVSHQPPPYFICPISQEIMDNPHVAADGYTYEANEFKSWISHGGVKSPMTNLKLDHHNLTPNIVLRTAIKDWLQQHPYYFDLSYDL